MIDFQFRTTQNIYFGKEAVGKLPELLNGCTDKVMLVYGGKSAKQNGAYDAITHALRMGGIAWVSTWRRLSPLAQNKQSRICGIAFIMLSTMTETSRT